MFESSSSEDFGSRRRCDPQRCDTESRTESQSAKASRSHKGDRPQAQKHIEAEIRRVAAVRDQFHTDTPVLDAKLTTLRERLAALHE